jgi:hypothetical protein
LENELNDLKKDFKEALNAYQSLYSALDTKISYFVDKDKEEADEREKFKDTLLKSVDDITKFLQDIDKIYEKMLTQKCLLPGWDFLYCIAFNYPKTKEQISYDKMQHYIVFFKLLGQVIPCRTYRKLYCKYMDKYNMEKYLDSGRNLTKWLHKINCSINKELSHEEDNKSYRRVCFVVESHRAKSCSKKSHKGKTCRKKTKVKQKDYIS